MAIFSHVCLKLKVTRAARTPPSPYYGVRISLRLLLRQRTQSAVFDWEVLFGSSVLASSLKLPRTSCKFLAISLRMSFEFRRSYSPLTLSILNSYRINHGSITRVVWATTLKFHKTTKYSILLFVSDSISSAEQDNTCEYCF